MYTKECKNCREAYRPRRKDNLYCSTQCKNEYNMKAYKKRHKGLLVSTERIKRNAQILAKAYSSLQQNNVSLYELEKMGFHPAFTNYRRPDGHLVVDNWALEELGQELYKIIPPKELEK